MEGHRGNIQCIAISNDANLCVSGGGDKEVRV